MILHYSGSAWRVLPKDELRYLIRKRYVNLKGVDSVDVPEINFKKGSLSLI